MSSSVRQSENYLLLVATACRWTFPTELASSKMKWRSCIGPRAGEERGGQNQIRRTAHQLTTVSVSIRWWSVERTCAGGGWLVDESTERERKKKGRLSRQQELGQSRAGVPETSQFLRLAPARHPKGFCTLNIEDQMVLYALQQRPLNLENAAGFSIYRVSLNGPLSI
jgi:hypothetical protein